MGSRAVVVCFALFACCGKSSREPQPQPQLVDPSVANAPKSDPTLHRVFRPTFIVDGQPSSAGSAFVIKTEDRLFLMTAHHLFGPAGGLEKDLSWQEMPKRVSSVEAASIDDETVKIVGTAPLAIEGAVGVSENRYGGDFAIFPMKDAGAARVLALANAAPKVGDRVALLAEVQDSTAKRHEATVIEVGADYLAYKFDTKKIELRATSGAPVVDANERVVAVNASGGEMDGSVVGLGTSIAAFGPAIQRALQTK